LFKNAPRLWSGQESPAAPPLLPFGPCGREFPSNNAGAVGLLRAANQAQEAAKSEASAATRDLYDQIDQLDEVFRPLAKNARAALRNEPGALEELGLKAAFPKSRNDRCRPGRARLARQRRVEGDFRTVC